MSDTTTTELERLRADLEVLERLWESVHFSECAIDFDKIKSRVRDKISSLEAEQADPWREAKEMLADKALFRSGRSRLKPVAELYDHLAAENARLEKRVKELENPEVSDPDAYTLGDFAVLKTAQEIIRYAMDRNPDRVDDTRICRRAIAAIADFAEKVRHWRGLKNQLPYRWGSLGRDTSHLLDLSFDVAESPADAIECPIHVNKGRTVATVAKMLRDAGEEQAAGVLVQMFGSGEPYEVCDARD